MSPTDRQLIADGLLMPGELILSQHVRRTLIDLRREVRELRKLRDLVQEADSLGVLTAP